ncbi:MAG: PA14 domain-containing protein, partial [Chloroflexota bacterium]
MSLKRLIYASLFALLMLATLALTAPETAAADNVWRAQYYNNKSLSGSPVLERDERQLNWDWGYGSPASQVHHDGFSARWIRTVNFSAGTYRFSASMDDGMRVWVDDVLIIDSWKDGAMRTIAANRTLSGGDHRIRVQYYDNTHMAYARLTWGPASPETIHNWRGEYFNNTSLSGSPVAVRDDGNIDFNWGEGSPMSGVNNDHFSARWTRNLTFEPGRYRFTARTDDGVRLWVNNRLLVDRWQPQTVQSHSGEIE